MTEHVLVPKSDLEMAIKIIDANLYHQREKVKDASSILKDALAAAPTPPVSLDEIREVLGNIAEHPGPHADEAAHWRAEDARALLSKLKEMGT